MNRLQVSDNGRYLVHEDGTPFTWIGDTAWHMVDTLDREAVDLYLANRAAKGFTVIQATAFMGHEATPGQLRNPANAYGHRPFCGGDEPDPASPSVLPGQEDYWDHVDYVVRETKAHGLYLALLPCWGSRHVNGRINGGEGVILDARNAHAYGAFLGGRYGREAHLVWVLGGDVGADEPTDRRIVYRRMAEGLIVGTSGQEVTWDQPHPAWSSLLMTYHPRGVQSSSQWFHHDAWLDLNMIQTFKHRERVYEMVEEDTRRDPVKPTVMGEPAYEGFGGHSKVTSNPYHVRRQAYQAFFAGAAGYTYGCAMSAREGEGPLFSFGPGWENLLDLPGAHQVAVELRAFLQAHAWWDLVPDQELILEGRGTGQTLKAAARAPEGRELLVYYPDRTPATLCLDPFAGHRVKATWFDPRSGTTRPSGTYPASASGQFMPPAGWMDAVLILQPRR